MSITSAPLAACLALGLAASSTPVFAQDAVPPYTPPPAESVDQGLGLIELGAGILMRNLLNEMAPEIQGISQDLAEAMRVLGPAVSDMAVLVDDISNYQTPERLENGDIIIRRKAGAPPPPQIGDGLRRFTEPSPSEPVLPIDPNAPEIEL